jgi:hypothetical protein
MKGVNSWTFYGTRHLFTVCLAVAFSCLLTGVVPAQSLDVAVKNLFREKAFDPHIIPFAEEGFDVAEHDPLVLQAEWESVRGPLSQLYAQHLGIASPPPLLLRFTKALPQDGKYRATARILTSRDARLRAALSRHLGCPSHVFFTGRNVAEMRTVELGAIRAKYKTGSDLALPIVFGDLLAMLQKDDGPFGKYNLSADGHVGRDEMDVLSGWKFYKQIGSAKRYFWRTNVRVARNNWRGWTLHSHIDLGRQLASQSAPKKVGDTHDDNVILNLESGRAVRTYMTQRNVNGDTSILPTDSVSPLGTLRQRLTNECLHVLVED